MAHKWHCRCKAGCSLILKIMYYWLVSETVTITNGVLLVSETYHISTCCYIFKSCREYQLHVNVYVYVCVHAWSTVWTVLKLMPVYNNMTVFLHQSAISVLPIFQTTGSKILRKKYQFTLWHCALFCLLFQRISLFVYPVYWTAQSVTDTVLHLVRGWLVNNELKRMYKAFPMA